MLGSYQLSLVEFWYNTSFCSAVGCTPFFFLYGHEPHHLGIDALATSDSSNLNTWIQDKDLMQQLIHQHVLRAQHKMKL